MSISTELFGHFVCAQHGDGAAGRKRSTFGQGISCPKVLTMNIDLNRGRSCMHIFRAEFVYVGNELENGEMF